MGRLHVAGRRDPVPNLNRAAGGNEVDAAVLIEGVSVRYRIPHEQLGSFKEFAIKKIQRKVSYQDFWALKDIDLSVGRGQVIGVIGRNGAGKSTLLRVIARVLRPTSGRVRVRGAVAPLLEVGAGFHPELTGRENVFLNATLLGHRHHETVERFDEIVAFSELEEFIDSPLRTYSSGMWARLGFAVATAWKPDILLIDEVLTVGDEDFQRKCQERIAALRSADVTVFIVAHDVGFIQTSCQHAVWLDHGSVRATGDPASVTDAYVRSFGEH